jgi:multisubunit Na+/H+ antiporter MnhB subunit
MHTILLSISALLAVVGSFSYCVSIVRGRTKPHRITRLVLLFVLALNFVGVIAAHGNPGAVLYGGIICAFGVIFFLLSLGRGMGGTTVFDWACFAIATAGVIGWQITGNAILGIWLAAFADFVAYVPAFVKTWKYPRTESPWLYILSGLAAILSTVAYPLGLVSAFQLITVVCAAGILVCIYHHRLFPMTS